MNKALKVAIIDRGLTQYEVAKRLGVGEARMSGFVHERFEPTPDEKKKLARILRREISDLFASSSSEAVA